jgi:hypothetical protein
MMAETMVSTLTNINLSVCSLPDTSAGTLNTDEMKAAWNETNLWFAITQPRSRNAPRTDRGSTIGLNILFAESLACLHQLIFFSVNRAISISPFSFLIVYHAKS